MFIYIGNIGKTVFIYRKYRKDSVYTCNENQCHDFLVQCEIGRWPDDQRLSKTWTHNVPIPGKIMN